MSRMEKNNMGKDVVGPPTPRTNKRPQTTSISPMARKKLCQSHSNSKKIDVAVTPKKLSRAEIFFSTPGVDKFFAISIRRKDDDVNTVTSGPPLARCASLNSYESPSKRPSRPDPVTGVRRSLSLTHSEVDSSPSLLHTQTLTLREQAVLGKKSLDTASKITSCKKMANGFYDHEGVVIAKAPVIQLQADDKRALPYSAYAYFETHTSEADNYGMPESELAGMWLSSLDDLTRYVSTAYYPSERLLHEVAYRGIQSHGFKKVRHACVAFIQGLVTYLHPPIDYDTRWYYFYVFFRNLVSQRSKEFDINEAWENVSLLIDAVAAVPNSKRISDDGNLLLVETLLLILERDLHHWAESCVREDQVSFSRQDWPLLALIFWSGDDFATVNYRMRSVIHVYVKTLTTKNVKCKRILRRFVCLFGVLIETVEKQKESNEAKERLGIQITREIKNLPDDVVSLQDLWSELFLLEPDWLSARVSSGLLHQIQSVEAVTLRGVVDRLVPPNQLGVTSDNADCDADSQSSQESNEAEDVGDNKTVSLNKTNKYGETTLHIACRTGNVKRVKAILDSPNVPLNSRDFNEWTPLHEACSHGRLECVKLLLEYRPKTIDEFYSQSKKKPSSPLDLFIRGGDQCAIPLQDAVTHGQIEIVRLLIEHHKKEKSLTKAMTEVTKLGQNVVSLASTDRMVQLLRETTTGFADIRPVTDASAKLLHVSDPSRYYVLAATFIYKYCATYRLHAIKAIMKGLAKGEAQPNPFFQLGANYPYRKFLPSKMTKFPMFRSSLTAAQDIRTYWRVVSKGLNPALEMMANLEPNSTVVRQINMSEIQC